MMRSLAAVFVLGCAAAWGCGGAGSESTAGVGGSGAAGGSGAGAGNGSSSTSSGASTSSGTGGAPAATGLPCDVSAVLSTYCWSCHGPTPSGGAPNALVTRDELAAPSKVNAGQSYAQRAIVRMMDPTSPMPPKPAAGVSTADRAVFESWVNQGLPAGTCGSSSSSSSGSTSTSSGSSSSSGGPYDTPVMCTSNTQWTGGDSGNADMHPGKACRSCHVAFGKATGKTFDVAGTVYPSAHEPDDCNGVSVAGAQVIITDANGQTHALDVNAVGNFNHPDLFGFAAFPVPYHAKVVYNGQERVMSAAQTSGDCNSCHTQDGASMAPGRIMLP